MMSRLHAPLPDVDKTQLINGHLSRGSLPIIMGLTLASHVVGMAAVYTQIVYLYGACLVRRIASF